MAIRTRLLVLGGALAPLAAWAGESEASTFDRVITIISSVVVPLLIALLGHHLGERRTKKEEEKVRARSVILLPPAPARPKTALNWLVEVGNAAAPTSQLVAPSKNRRRWMPVAVAAVLVASGAITAILVSRLVSSNDSPKASAPVAPVAVVISDAVGMFADRGEFFVRAGSSDGLAMGVTIHVLDAKRTPIGDATVVEVWESLARVRPDPRATAAGPAFATFKGAPAKPAAAVAAVPRRQATPTPPATPIAKAGLKGDARLSAFGPTKRIMLYNTGTAAWTGCDLRLPNNTKYRLESLAAGSSDGIMITRFTPDGVERELAPTWLDVACAQGSARFVLRE